MDSNSLCPAVKYPVPAGTPLISPLVNWDHAQAWDVPKVEDFSSGSGGSNSATVYNIGKKCTSGLSSALLCICPLWSDRVVSCILTIWCVSNNRDKRRVSRLLPAWTLHRRASPLPGDGLPGAGLAYIFEKPGGRHGKHPRNLRGCHHPQSHHPTKDW